MPRVCSICTHPERPVIDRALVTGEPYRRIAQRCGVSPDAVNRHKRDHLPAAMVQAATETDVRQALDVVAQLKAINAAALIVLRDARGTGDGALALKAIDRIQRQIELQAKLLGDLDERPVVNVLVQPEFQRVQVAIVAALAPYPEARAAVGDALAALEGGA